MTFNGKFYRTICGVRGGRGTTDEREAESVDSSMRSVHRTANILDDIDDTVYSMNEKLARVVGVRRVS